MAKVLTGKVISTSMTGVVVVEVTRKTPHPLYKKLLKRSKKFKVALNGATVTVGDTVSMIETRPMSKDTHFALFTPEKKPTRSVRQAAAKEARKETVTAEAEVKEATIEIAEKAPKKSTKKKEAK